MEITLLAKKILLKLILIQAKQFDDDYNKIKPTNYLNTTLYISPFVFDLIEIFVLIISFFKSSSYSTILEELGLSVTSLDSREDIEKYVVSLAINFGFCNINFIDLIVQFLIVFLIICIFEFNDDEIKQLLDQILNSYQFLSNRLSSDFVNYYLN